MEKLYTVCLPVTEKQWNKEVEQFIGCVYAESELDARNKVSDKTGLNAKVLTAKPAQNILTRNPQEKDICAMFGFDYTTDDEEKCSWLHCMPSAGGPLAFKIVEQANAFERCADEFNADKQAIQWVKEYPDVSLRSLLDSAEEVKRRLNMLAEALRLYDSTRSLVSKCDKAYNHRLAAILEKTHFIETINEDASHFFALPQQTEYDGDVVITRFRNIRSSSLLFMLQKNAPNLPDDVLALLCNNRFFGHSNSAKLEWIGVGPLFKLRFE